MKPLIRFEMNSKKGESFLETLLDKVGGKYNYIVLLKLAFFADRYHIRNYARPVGADDYLAMRHGAVPSNLKDILESKCLFEDNIQKDKEYMITLKSSENIDKTQFSTSDIEAIDFAIEKFSKVGSNDIWNLPDLCHAYPEWIEYKDQFNGDNKNNSYDMNFLDFLKNANPNHPDFKKLNFTDPFTPLTDLDRKDLTEEIQEVNNLYGEDS